MSSPAPSKRAYKEVTLQQLRSFCQTVHLGSLSAAAASLGLAHPTVWKQVHALERQFGMPLIQSNTRGCRPTEAGRALAELAHPLVTGIDSLKQSLQEVSMQPELCLTIAATQRFLVEDLPICLVEFKRRYPSIRLELKEVRAEEVASAVESGNADLGFGVNSPACASHWLSYEPCYELEIFLIAPPDHPLARRRRVRARDLCAYPLVNAPSSFIDPTVTKLLDALGVFKNPTRRVEGYSVETIRCYVAMGFGIGLIGVSPSYRPNPDFHERSMSHELGRMTICSIRKKSAVASVAVREFFKIVKAMMSPPANGQASPSNLPRLLG